MSQAVVSIFGMAANRRDSTTRGGIVKKTKEVTTLRFHVFGFSGKFIANSAIDKSKKNATTYKKHFSDIDSEFG